MKFNADELEVFTVGVSDNVAVVELTDDNENIVAGDQIEFLVKDGFRPLYESWIDDSRHALSTTSQEFVSVQVIRFPSQRGARGVFEIGSPLAKEVMSAKGTSKRYNGTTKAAPMKMLTRRLRQFLFLG